MLKITENAKIYIREQLLKHNKANLCISVVKGGCSGMMYKFDFADLKESSDEEVRFEDFSLFIKNSALLFIVGSTLDYQKTMTGSFLVFKNPNAKGACGCGKSFYS